MRFSDIMGAALGSLWQRKFRTSLTVLGVLIGTTAVVVMMSIGIGLSQTQLQMIAKNASLRQIEVYGAPTPTDGRPSTTRMDDRYLNELKNLPGVERAWPVYQLHASVRIGTENGYLQIIGLPHDILAGKGFTLASGAIPAAGAPLALVVGDRVGYNFGDISETGPASRIDIANSQYFLTVGEDPAAGLPGMVPGKVPGTQTPATPPKRIVTRAAAVIDSGGALWSEQAMSAYADIKALIKALEKAMPGKALPGQDADSNGRPRGSFTYSAFILEAPDVATAEQLTSELKTQGYPVRSDLEWMREMQNQAMLVQAVFGGIGFISLLVAAIGIANTMMMSVYERTKEIGVMKVLGAAITDIRKMFLVESSLIGLLGGAIGVLFSLALSAVLNATLGRMAAQDGVPATISVIPVQLSLGAVVFATLIGTVAGLVPAHRAMRLSPLAAIRSQ